MDFVLDWIEPTALSTWLKRSPSLWGWPFVLILHTWSLAFLVGSNVVLHSRVLGLARGVPLRAMERYFLVMWLAFGISAASGVLLLVAYPTKALTNPLFYLKLALIAAAFALALRLKRPLSAIPADTAPPLPPRLKVLAAVSLACWIAAIFAGRLLAYTCSPLTTGSRC
jgi:hypothetical protein